MLTYTYYSPYVVFIALFIVIFILWLYLNNRKLDGRERTDVSEVDTVKNNKKRKKSKHTQPATTMTVDNTPRLPKDFERKDDCSLRNMETPIPFSKDVAMIVDDDDIKPITEAIRKKGRIVSKGERICCETMEKIFGVPFYTSRPAWLKNPETGYNLELDCYNEDLAIAVEYNGIQHYRFPNFTNQTEDQFIKQLRRDSYKANTCDKNHVYLITVPFNVSEAKIPEYIISLLPDAVKERIQWEKCSKEAEKN